MTGSRLFVLAIDHRSSFRRWSSEVTGASVAAETLGRLKVVVAEAMALAARSLSESDVALLVDEEYGREAMSLARSAAVKVVVPAERSGRPEFEFEHGDAFAAAIVATRPDVVKALVRYNPSDDPERNARSRRRLVRLARWCSENGYPLMLELLVPPTEHDLDDDDGLRWRVFDQERRTGLTCTAVEELREAGLAPAWWKLEGQPDVASFAAVAAAAGGPCLVLGRGADRQQVETWIEDAALARGFAGFAVGRSLWMDALARVLLGDLSPDDASAQIADAYIGLVALYDKFQKGGG